MDNASPISETVFRRLVARMSARDLRRLPVERLPRSIPVDMVDCQIEPDKHAVLNELAWHVAERDLAGRREAGENLDATVRDALEAAEAAGTHAAPELERLTARLARAWREGDFRSDALSASNQELERARTRAREISEEVGRLYRALAMLDQPIVADAQLQARISDARLHARKTLGTLETALGRFELFQVDIAQGDMRVRREHCDYQLARRRELEEQIRVVEEKLQRPSGLWRRLISPRLARQQREALRERLERLTRQRDGFDVLVSEDDLMNWLDVLVNASLHVPREQWRQRAQRTRVLLFRLLNLYCLQQETAAHEIALRAVPGVNGREAIGYYLNSERFILGYFARKRKEVTLWLAGAADDKLDRLDRVRQAILADYRRNTQNARALITEAYGDDRGADAANAP